MVFPAESNEENDLKLRGVFPRKYNEKLVKSGSRVRLAFSLSTGGGGKNKAK